MTIIRNVLACVLGLVLGSVINMAIITIGPDFIPPPEGVDVTSAESIADNIHLFRPVHFLPPFLAHALGTLFGAVVAVLVAASYRTLVAYFVGVAFLAGGIMAASMIPAPTWFLVADLGLAYLPMAMIAGWLGRRLNPGKSMAGSTGSAP